MFSGSLVAIVTPMRPDGSLDLPAWSRLLDFHRANGTRGIVVGGTTGESATLVDTELRELTERACEQLGQSIPIIVGIGTSSTAATVERAKQLSQLPISALLVVTPPYNRPTQEGLYRHFSLVAQASRVPVLPYNVPSRTAVDLLPETVGRLAQLSGIVGIKEAVPQVERVRELIGNCGPKFIVLSGDDATAREAMLAGARGVVSVTANVAPRAMADLAAAAAGDEPGRARQLDAALTGLHRDLFIEANPIPAKWLLLRMGLVDAGIRLPLTELAEAHRAMLEASARVAGIVFQGK